MSRLDGVLAARRNSLLLLALLAIGVLGIVLWSVARRRGAHRLNMFAAISEGDVAAVREILAQDPEAANRMSEGGQTPLSFAAWCFWLGGNKWWRESSMGEKPTRSGCAQIAQVLIDNGAQVDARNASGKTALQIAAMSRNLEVARVLIAGGADVNARGESGETPLHWAAIAMRTEIVQLLLANGANPGLKTRNGETALDWLLDCADGSELDRSEQAEYEEIVEILQNHTKTRD